VSTQPINDERLAELQTTIGIGLTWAPDKHRIAPLAALDDLLAALVAVRAERDRLIDLYDPPRAAVSSPGEARKHSQECDDHNLIVHASTGGDTACICGADDPSSPGEDGSVLRCSLAAIHSPHCWAMYGDDDSPWYRCPGEETP
jgi:hypothetical protein